MLAVFAALATSTDALAAAIVNPAKLDHKASSQVCGQCHGILWIQDRNDWLRYGFSFRAGRELTQSGTPLVRPRVIDELPWLAPAL